MSREHESAMPPEIRHSLRDEPPAKRSQFERLWKLLGEMGDRTSRVPPTDEAWIDVVEKLEAREASVRRAPDRLKLHRRRAIAAAAVTVAVAVVVGFWWMYRPATVSTPAGVQQTVGLPDGSTVELNSETSIRFARRGIPIPVIASSTRRISLDGEAYFRVVASSEPFVVQTEEAEVEVMGTEFNVRSRRGPAEDGTVVTLASGSVRLTARSGSSPSMTLSEPGGAARVSRAAEVILLEPGGAAPLDHVLAWRRSGFAVVNRPLEAVLDEVERRYAIEIAPRRGVDLEDSMTAFYLRGASPDQILGDICLVQACTYRETSQGFALSLRDTSEAAEAGTPSAESVARPK